VVRGALHVMRPGALVSPGFCILGKVAIPSDKLRRVVGSVDVVVLESGVDIVLREASYTAGNRTSTCWHRRRRRYARAGACNRRDIGLV